MGSITHFFGEDVARVDGNRGMVEIHLLCLNTVTNGTIFEVNMSHALCSGAFGPVNSPLVVIVDTVGLAASGRFMLSQRWQRERISLTASSVARISASQVERLVCS